jgi:peptidoglycan/LPS O-acetylase OafA/YrhL
MRTAQIPRRRPGAKDDNFLMLRFIAAALVIYGHAPAITGGGGPTDLFVWLNWGEYSGDIAVDLFFITSGFLVMGSWQRRSHVLDFVLARVVRIFPALAVVPGAIGRSCWGRYSPICHCARTSRTPTLWLTCCRT